MDKYFPKSLVADLIMWIKNTFTQKAELDAYQKITDADLKYATKEEISEVSLGYTAENVANKAQPRGYASLDDLGKVPEAQLPSSALKDTTYTNATTTNDGLMSSAQVSKLSRIQDGAEENKIAVIKRNGTILNPTDKTIDITVPVNVSDLTNDSKFVTRTTLDDLLANVNSIKYEYVTSLPTTGEKDVIYVVPSPEPVDKNVKTEYFWTGTEYEKFGEFSSDVDLTGHWSKTELVAMTSAELQDILNA